MSIDLDKIYCAAIKRGEIFLVAGNENEKEQLMVIIQDNILNERLTTVLAIPLHQHREGSAIFKNELLLKPSETSLNRPTVCRTYKLEAVDRHRLRAKTGELNHTRLQELYEVLDISFGRFRDRS